jgi:predicted nucleic acid-binding protein
MTAGDSFFLDTNILLYRLSINEPAKQRAAQDWISALWAAEQGRISWQVVFEFYSNAVRKIGIPAVTARRAVEQWTEWNPTQPTLTQVQRAWHWCDAAHSNFWDALIVAAAEQSGCRWLVSEDFQAGQRFGAVTVLNPFQRAPAEFGLSVR